MVPLRDVAKQKNWSLYPFNPWCFPLVDLSNYVPILSFFFKWLYVDVPSCIFSSLHFQFVW